MLCRCPNPAACNRNAHCLAQHHPYNRTAQARNQALTWEQYGLLLCTQGKGYQGILCGTCANGWGATAPFTCKRCLGVDAGVLGQGHMPSIVQISLVYVLYWAVLTVLTIVAVASAMSLARCKEPCLCTKAFKSARPEEVCSTLSTASV